LDKKRDLDYDRMKMLDKRRLERKTVEFKFEPNLNPKVYPKECPLPNSKNM
jgi:hypothetical protein